MNLKTNFNHYQKIDHSVKSFHNYLFKRLVLVVAFSAILILIFGTYASIADTNSLHLKLIKNQASQECLTYSSNRQVYLMNCLPSTDQNFFGDKGFIKANQLCLNVSKIIKYNFNLATCSNDPSQVWLVSGDNLYNPLFEKCLNQTNHQLTLSTCQYNSNKNQAWNFEYFHNGQFDRINGLICPKNLNLNQQISCQAMMQWNLWHQPNSNHLQLLNHYTDGFGLEEWCADFVSYIYKISGQPFVNGERNNWDEYNANYVYNEPIFSQHQADHYIPKAGDVAFFDYPGGHVEIVVVGGSHPTFIYGDSNHLDPQTGNGDMAADSITKDGRIGQVVYYLNPS